MELQKAEKKLKEKGFLDVSLSDKIDYAAEIKRLK